MKIQNMDKENIPKKRKLNDTALNIWIKGLRLKDKRLFLKLMTQNRAIWAEAKDIDTRIKGFNNYRYSTVCNPSHPAKIFIYMIAKSFDKDLLISTIFPDVNQSYISPFINIFFKTSIITNHFNVIENAKNQSYTSHFIDNLFNTINNTNHLNIINYAKNQEE